MFTNNLIELTRISGTRLAVSVDIIREIDEIDMSHVDDLDAPADMKAFVKQHAKTFVRVGPESHMVRDTYDAVVAKVTEARRSVCEERAQYELDRQRQLDQRADKSESWRQ